MATPKDKLIHKFQDAIRGAKWDQAVDLLGRLSEQEPRNPFYPLRRGDYWVKLGESEEALGAYHAAARLYMDGGFLVKALAVYKLIARIDPENAEARAGIRRLHRQSGEAASRKPAAPDREAWTEPSGPVWSPPDVISHPDKGESSAAESRAAEHGWGVLPVERPELSPEEELSVIGAAGEALRLTDVIPLFASLTPEEFYAAVDRMTLHRYPAGKTILREGDRGDSVFILSRGRVRVSTRMDGREMILAELRENDFFGEVGFLTGRSRTADVMTVSGAEILELRGDDLRDLIDQHPRIREVLEIFSRARAEETVALSREMKGVL